MAKSLLDSAKTLPKSDCRTGPAAWYSRLDCETKKQIDEIIDAWIVKTPWLLEKFSSKRMLSEYIVEKTSPGVNPQSVVSYIRKREAERGKQKRS